MVNVVPETAQVELKVDVCKPLGGGDAQGVGGRGGCNAPGGGRGGSFSQAAGGGRGGGGYTQGRAVQVDPMKPMLKARGTERLKLEYDESPSNFAFKSKFRRYSKESEAKAKEGEAAETSRKAAAVAAASALAAASKQRGEEEAAEATRKAAAAMAAAEAGAYARSLFSST